MSTKLMLPPEKESLDATVIVHKLDLPNCICVEDESDSKTAEVVTELVKTAHPAAVESSASSSAIPFRPLDDGAALQQNAEQGLLRSRLLTATIVSLLCMTAFFLRSMFIDEPVVSGADQ